MSIVSEGGQSPLIPPASLSYNYEPGAEISLQHGGVMLWRYHFATDRQKPHFHPVCTTHGAELTCLEPWDHWWHRGLWFSWQFINAVNYWEEDIEEMGPKGSIEFIGLEQVNLDPEQVVITTQYQYRPPRGEVIMDDVREITIGIPRDDGHYTIDWKLTFTPMVDVRIERVNEEWGGYSGLSWRTSRGMGKLELMNSEGQIGEATQHQPATWVDLTGNADGGRELIGGMTMMVHPETPRCPAHWKTFKEKGFGYINPSPIMVDPLELKANEPFQLMYRVLVHAGSLDKETLDEEYQRYCELE